MLQTVPDRKEDAPAKAKPTPKVKTLPVQPTDVTEVWRLYEKWIRSSGAAYPDLSEDKGDVIMSHLFQYMQARTFAGMRAVIGKKTVGIILGNLSARPIGRPSRFVYLTCLFVDPAHRGQGIGKSLWQAYSESFKRVGVFNFECQATDEVAKGFLAHVGGARVLNIVGGKL